MLCHRHFAAIGLLVLGATACERDDAEPSGAAGPMASTPAASAAAAAPTASARAADSADAAPPDAGSSNELVFLAGGDVNMGRGLGQKLLKDPSYDPFREVAPVFAEADLIFVNLESQLSDQDGETQSPSNRLIFTGPPEGAAALARAGVDVVSLANNHAWDYGRQAFLETMENLERAGVAYSGVSRESGKQYQPTILRHEGWSVALFSVTHIWNQGPINEHAGVHHVAWARYDLLSKHLKAARKEHDVVLVSYHGGAEYVDVPMLWTKEFVRAVMLAGVDAVIGHHPHIPQGIEWFGDRPVLYSLGNFVFPMHRDHVWTGTSFLAKLSFKRTQSGIERSLDACPYHILGHVPMRFEGKAKAARERQLESYLKRTSLGLGGVRLGPPGKHSCMSVSPPEKPTPLWKRTLKDDPLRKALGKKRPPATAPSGSAR